MPKWQGGGRMITGILIIGAQYVDKNNGKIYTLKDSATCKERDIQVVVYSDSKGNLYTLSVSEFKARFEQQETPYVFRGCCKGY